jgi:hypothetical protein
MKKAIDWKAIDDRLIPLVGRGCELQQLKMALRMRQSRLITGSAGMGKTRLLVEAGSQWAAPYLLIRSPLVLHELLVELAQALRCRVTGTTTMALKPAVLESLKREPRVLLVEDARRADPRMYHFLQAIYRTHGNCLIVTARSRESLGYSGRLFWDPRQQIPLPPLKSAQAAAVFAAAVKAYDLDALDLDAFRSQALRSARGNPGQIVAMCRLAAQPEYRQGRHVKFLPLRMDALQTFIR